MTETIHIIHTNDLHSHFEHWPKIRRYITHRQAELREENSPYLTLDLGDFMDRVHPFTEATDGRGNVELLNHISYDLVTLGNNEGITNSKEELDNLFNEATFEVLLSNLENPDGSYPQWLIPEKIIVTPEGTRIGVLALTAYMPLSYVPFGWNIREPLSVLEERVPHLRKKVDVLLLMSHLGMPDDKEIAMLYPEIDVIIQSHTHHLLKEGLTVNRSLLAAAGRFGEYVGEVTLTIEKGQILEKKAGVQQVSLLEESPSDALEIDTYLVKGNTLLEGEVVTTLPVPLLKQNTLIETTLEAMKDQSGCDVALVNSGLFLTDLETGPVSKKTLHDCLPHPMNLIKVCLKGKDVIRLVKEIEKNRDFLRFFKVVGMKFRGNIFGEIWYDGITYEKHTGKILWREQEIESEEMYELVTVDHLAFLPFFPTIEIAGEITLLGPDFLRTVLGIYLNKKYKRE